MSEHRFVWLNDNTQHKVFEIAEKERRPVSDVLVDLVNEGLERRQERADLAKKVDGLTNRENDVMELLRMGCTNRQIAESLYISVETVRTHVRNIMGKTGINDRRVFAEIL